MEKIVFGGLNNNGKTVINKNGRRIVIDGGTIRITDGVVTVDGKSLNELENTDANEKTINISIEGNVERLEVDVCQTIKITGDCRRVKTNCGSIEIGGDVSGDVHTNMGSITCGNVDGDCHTNMGSINKR